jgi:RHS repeat-associated protein
MEMSEGCGAKGSTRLAEIGEPPEAVARAAPPRRKGGGVRWIRSFAVLAALVLLLATFAGLARPAAAQAGTVAAATSPTVGSTRYGPGIAVTSTSQGRQVGFLPTFQRWDGSYRPMSALNISSGDWPYLVTQGATAFTVTRLGYSFSQTRIPNATYAFEPDRIVETIILQNASVVPAYHSLGVGLWGSYLPVVSGTHVSLVDPTGNLVWQTAEYAASDSSPTPHVYPKPVVGASWTPGSLALSLDPTMLTWATYPLYIDPTWVLKAGGNNAWAGTLDHVTSDWGDSSLKIGYLADDFNNANSLALDGSTEIKITSGTSGSGTLVTTYANDVLIVDVGVKAGVNSVSSITSSPSLTWMKRGSVATSTNAEAEEWYAEWSSSGSISITVNLASAAATYAVPFGVSGANFASPFDSHSGLPATAYSTSSSGSPSVSLSTTNANDLILGFLANPGANVVDNSGAGFTLIRTGHTSTGIINGNAEYKAVSSAQTGLAVTWTSSPSEVFAAIADAIVAASGSGGSSLTLDGSAAINFSSGTSGSTTLATTNVNDILVVTVGVKAGVNSVSSITSSPSLTWTKRGAVASTTNAEAEEWYAKWSSSGSINVTVNLGSSAPTYAVAFGVSGANYTSPFDAHAGLPATAYSTSSSGSPSVSISTANPSDLILGFLANPGSGVTDTAGAGYTLIRAGHTSSGIINGNAEYKLVTSAQTGLSVGWTSSPSEVYAAIADAIVAGSNPGGGTGIWTVTSGSSYIRTGGRGQLIATEIHASGSWTNLTLGTTLNFASCGVSNLLFRYASSTNYYYLKVNFASNQVTLYKVINGVTTALSSTLSIPMSVNTSYDVKVLARGNYFEVRWNGTLKWNGTDASPPGSPLIGNIGLSEVTSSCTLYVDNVRVRDPIRWWGNYTSPIRDAGSGNVVTQVRFQGTADSYNDVDLWINSSSDNATWSGWHIVKTMAAPGFYLQVPGVDQKRYYQIRGVLRTGVDGTPSVQEIDALESSPPTGVSATTNTGSAPWYLYVGGAVNAVSGNLVLSWTDLSIGAKGFTISVVRTYNSALAGIAGPFGLGTMDSFHAKLSFPSGGNVTLTAGDGGVYTFTTMGGTAYSPPRGVHDNLVKNADGTYALWQPDGSRENFNMTGKLTSLVDRNGNHLTLTYTNGNPTRVADDSGLSLTFTYDSSNRISYVVDPMNRKVSYTYDGSNRLVTLSDPMLFTDNYTYDVSNRLTQLVDRAGHVDRIHYDSSGRVDQIWTGEWNYAGAGSIRWQVEAYALTYVSGTQMTARNALGGVTTATFNALGNPSSIAGPSVGCALCSGGNSTTYTWDGEFDRLTIADGRGDTNSFSYDWMGNTLTSKDPGGNMTVQTVLNVQNATQFVSLLTSTTTPKGYTTRYTYYANGNLYAVIHPDGNAAYSFYDSAGSLTRYQDFRGNSATDGYDSHEFLVNSTDAGGNKTTYQNDAIGRMWNTTTPYGTNTTRTVYDKDSRVNTTKDPMGNTTYYLYDNDGRTTKTTDPNNLATTYGYNLSFGGFQKTTSPGGNTTQYVYDNVGNRIQLIDANGHVTKFAYDSFRRVLNQTTPLGYVTKYVYDAAGNVVFKVEANGSRISYVYDKSNRLNRTTYPSGPAETIAYDADGNVKEKKAFELDQTFMYDSLERVTQTKQVFLDASLVLYHSYTYDANGNRKSMDGNGGGTYVWDKNSRIYSQTDSVGNRWIYAYGKDGQLLKETYPNGAYVTYAYDRDGRLLLKKTYLSGGSIFESLGYAYDKVGNVVTEQNSVTTESASLWQYSGCCSSITFNLTAYGLQPTPQTVNVSVSASGFMVGGAPGNPDTGYVAYYYVLNGVTTYLGTSSYTLTGTLKPFSGTFSAPVSVYNADRLAGKITFSSNSGSSAETTNTLSLSIRTTGTIPTTYVYDKEYRIYKATYLDASLATYTYDAVGNNATYKLGTTTITSTYNADNELLSSSNGISYTYDANGNRISMTVGSTTIHYAFNYANELEPVSTTVALSTSSYHYCGGGVQGCTATLQAPTLLPSAQTVTVTFSASVIETDLVNSYPNCVSATVYWYYVLNGVQTLLGSEALSLNKKNGGCFAVFNATYTPALTLHKGDTLYEIVAFENDSLVGGTVNSMSVSTAALSVPPYVMIQYGPDGVQASETINQGPVTHHFDYDLLGMGGLPQTVGDYNGTTLAAQYFFGVGADSPLDLIVGGVSYYYDRDVLGSITNVMDSTGHAAASYHYNAYGNLMSGSADTIGNPLRFAGLASDATTGLVYDRARWYDPSTGRYLTPDPLGAASGPNRYAYAGDNPVNFVDPTGMFPKKSGGGGGGGGSGTSNSVGGTPQPTPSPPKSASFDCQMSVASFAIGLFFTALGIWGGLSGAQGIAYSLVTTWQWDTVANMLTGDVGGFFSLFLDIGWSVLTNYIVKQPWWAQFGLFAQLLGEFISQEWVINLLAVGMQIVFGLAGIWQHCI